MGPYDIDIEKLEESKEVTSAKNLLKLELIAAFLKETSKMDSREILDMTGLHKSDLSRLRAMNYSRFTLDKIVGLLDSLGLSASVKVSKKRAS